MGGFSDAINAKQKDETSAFDYGILYTEPMKDAWVGGYLNSPDNLNKNFVQRINSYNDSVALQRPAEEGGTENLRMANQDNTVYPTIEARGGELHSLARGSRPHEVIETTTPQQAEVLAWNEYKRLNPSFGYGNRAPSLLEHFSYGAK